MLLPRIAVGIGRREAGGDHAPHARSCARALIAVVILSGNPHSHDLQVLRQQRIGLQQRLARMPYCAAAAFVFSPSAHMPYYACVSPPIARVLCFAYNAHNIFCGLMSFMRMAAHCCCILRAGCALRWRENTLLFAPPFSRCLFC